MSYSSSPHLFWEEWWARGCHTPQKVEVIHRLVRGTSRPRLSRRNTVLAAEGRPSFLQQLLSSSVLYWVQHWALCWFFLIKTITKKRPLTFHTWSEIWLVSYIFSDRVTFDYPFHFETGRPTGHLEIKMHLSLAVLISFCSACYSGRIEITIVFCATSL